MSHVPSLCLYRSSRKYPAARERASERGLTRTFIRATSITLRKTGASMVDCVPKNARKCNANSIIYIFSLDNSKIFDNLGIVLMNIHLFICEIFCMNFFYRKVAWSMDLLMLNYSEINLSCFICIPDHIISRHYT